MTSKTKYHKKRDIYYQSLSVSQKLLVAVSLAATIFYLHWRLDTFNHDAPWFSYTLYVAEIYGFLTIIMHLFMLKRMTVRHSLPVIENATVDVFITIYNEELDIVRRTAIAARKMDYPHTVYLLDDGNRDEIRILAERLGCRYLARTTNEHAKAGNLNNGLKYSNGEFIVVLDVDHAPTRSFITHTLGYFRDKEVAFVQTPQDFYNLDSFQHRGRKTNGEIWTEQSLFFRVIQRGKDYWNAAFFCGSCAIIRRSSLDKIGGFATGTITEDLHTSIKLHKAGFKSIYHEESLAYGIAPSQMGAFIKQRKRWGMGAMQVWRTEGILFSPQLTFPQKINYLASVMTYFDGWQRLFYYICPALVLISGVLPILTTTEQFLIHFVPYFVLNILMFEEMSRGYGRTFYIEQYNMARFHAFCSTVFGWLTKHMKFVVTNKNLTGAKKVYVDVMPQIAIFMFNCMAICIGVLLHYFTPNHLTSFSLWCNALWSFLCMGMAASVIQFALRCARFKRDNYRFQLPLNATIRFIENDITRERYVSIRNISSTGFMFAIDKGVRFKKNTRIFGSISLSTKTVDFTALVRKFSPKSDHKYMHSVGCEFDWQDTKALEQLEAFLYGSNLEWRINNITERKATMFEKFFSQYFSKLIPVDMNSRRNSNLMKFTKSKVSYSKPLYANSNEIISTHTKSMAHTTGYPRPFAKKTKGNGITQPNVIWSLLLLLLFMPLEGKAQIQGVSWGFAEGEDNLLVIDEHGMLPDNSRIVSPKPNITTPPPTAIAPPAKETPQKLFFSGVEAGNQGTAYGLVGVVAPLPVGHNRLGDGWVTRLIAYGNGYEYKKNSSTIKARGAGTELSVGYMGSGDRGWWGAYMGPAFGYLKLKPNDVGNKSEGRQVALNMQLEGERQITENFKVNSSGLYQAFRNNNFWTRLRPLTRAHNSIYVGPELSYRGDNSYRAWQSGLVVNGIPVAQGVQMEFKAGVQKTNGDAAGGYVGLEFGTLFNTE